MITQALCGSSRASWLFIAAAPVLFANCSSKDSNGGSGGSPVVGGAATGGASTAQGGSSSGGAPSGTTGGGASTAQGGSSSGGAASGATGGGAASGGAASGGAANGATGGGAASGGAANGATGGGAAGGGAASGGSSSAGQNGNSGGSSGVSGAGGTSSAGAAGASGSTGGSGSGGTFILASADMVDGAKFDTKFTCNGGSIGTGQNPELHWSEAPAGTMSFAITFIDTTIGASKQMGQHWAMWNIPASVMKLPQGTTAPTGDFANAKQSGKYLAPCAVTLVGGMDDEYEFTVYALSTATLNVSGSSVANALTTLGVLPNGMLASSVLGTATFHGHAGVGGK